MRLLPIIVSALLLTGCTAAAPEPDPAPSFEELPEPADAARTPAVACADEALAGSSTWTSADGAWFETGIIGEGTTVAVFVPQSGESYCGFVDFASVLAEAGIQSVLINLCGVGATECGLEDNVLTSGANAVLAAAEQARADGATRVVAVGASMGGTTVILASALSKDDGPLDAVADLSGPIEFAGVDTQPLAGDIAIPMLLAVSGADAVVNAAELDQLGSASSSPNWVRYSGTGHGWAMLSSREVAVTDLALTLVDFIAG